MMSAAALTGATYAGPTSVGEEQSCGSWCDTLETIGTVYKSKENPYIQKIKFFGRAQIQMAYVDGSGNDGDFNQDFDEFRRLRAGAEVAFLNGFKLKGNVNFVKDNKPKGGEREFGYHNFDQLKLSYSKKDVLGFDKAGITYGRHKIKTSWEEATSSKKIKTVERSAIANKAATARGTGVTLSSSKGAWDGTLGLFSTKKSEEAWGGWNEKVAFYLGSEYECQNGTLQAFYLYAGDENKTYDDTFDYDWVTSLAYNHDVADWNLTYNGILGENRDDQGLFYGFVFLATTDIVEDKLEFATRYYYQGAEEAGGISANSRYLGRVKDGKAKDGDIQNHHSIYAGLNWYLCGDHSKVMTGVELEQAGDVDTGTLWAAYRMYF